jgi:hypothetical protein
MDYLRFGSNPNDDTAEGFYASATRDEIHLAASISGVEVLDIVPGGLYRNNAVFASSLGADEHALFKEAFDKFYADEKVRSFVQWFELTVTKKLPLALINTFTVVARKAPR